MYRPETKPKERVGTLVLVIGLHVAVAAFALTAGGVAQLVKEEAPIEIFDVALPVPPPPQVDLEKPDDARPREEGAASAKNIESNATPVEAPKPAIKLPPVNPIVASPTPNEGSDPTQGASNERGEGTGAGGVGDGTGSGAGGDGKGGGGGTRPSVIRDLVGQDYPDEVWRLWPPRAEVHARFKVHPDGTISDCTIDRSSGVPSIDEWTCALLRSKATFRPATDAYGRPYTTWYGYIQAPTGKMIRRR